MRLSVVVPTLEEEATLDATLARVRAAGVHELIVVDGGSRDRTAAVAARHADRVLRAPPGRATQMNAGAAAASGDVLLFLHADTLLPPDFAEAIARALADPAMIAGRFDLRLDGDSPLLPVVAAAINWRSRWSRIATGDQAVSPHVQDPAGGCDFGARRLGRLEPRRPRWGGAGDGPGNRGVHRPAP